ncbi:MAG: hypothetical protein WDO13_00495 [Verrucomicrobiota bacterium]
MSSRGPLLLAALGLVAVVLAGCHRATPAADEARIVKTFGDAKAALIANQPDRAAACFASSADTYLAALSAPPAGRSASPTVDLYLRTALARKVPANLRDPFTLATLARFIGERQLLKPRDLDDLALGRIAIDGDGRHATAALLDRKATLPISLPFVLEEGAWKIDLVPALPYIDVLLGLDRVFKGQTPQQQVDQLVAKLPSF